MENLKKEYRDLESRVQARLREAINKSKYESEHVSEKAIKVSVSDYTELAIVNDRLIFLDENGLQYSLFNDVTLEDLIDILESIK